MNDPACSFQSVEDFAQALLQKASITPVDDGVQDILVKELQKLGFSVTLLPYGEGEKKTLNFFARKGTAAPHICFAGHTDVVPPGDSGWIHAPFSGTIEEGVLYGRGACDMKGGIAAFIMAVQQFVTLYEEQLGSISFLITGDEEGTGEFGTKKVLEWMVQNRHIPDFCLVGEPTNPHFLGETIKIGRRGSLNASIVVKGEQGHVAYPHRAKNPLHMAIPLLQYFIKYTLDEGNEWFEPSSLQITSIDADNVVTNLIPAEVKIRLNIRFNTEHTGRSLEQWLKESIERFVEHYTLEVHISGEAFLSPPSQKTFLLQEAVKEAIQQDAAFDTGGGTSDARFIAHYCPVAEFGLVGQSMHKVNEHVLLDDLKRLQNIYYIFLKRVFL